MKVVIISACLRPYRVPFFLQLGEELAREGISLKIWHGPEHPNTRPSNSVGPGVLPAGLEVWTSCHYLGRRVRWHRLPREVFDADLVIVPQLTSMLGVYRVIASRWFGRLGRVAFWGHGRNFRSSMYQRPAEHLKKFISRRVDWWFAYNRHSARVIEDFEFPADRITEVRNSVDTSALLERESNIKEEELRALRSRLGIGDAKIGIYTGSLTALKRIEFLIEAAKLIRAQVTDFHLIILGDGPLSDLVRRAAEDHDWIHWEGPKFETEKVPYWMMSELLLMPGGVGLVAIDSLALGVPMVTTSNRLHGPEIDYLRSGQNSLIVPDESGIRGYSDAVVGLLTSPGSLRELREGCRQDADSYSMEQMVRRFAGGVRQALDRPRYRFGRS